MIIVLLIFNMDKKIQYQHLGMVLMEFEENSLYAFLKDLEFCKDKINVPSRHLGQIDKMAISNQPEILGSWPIFSWTTDTCEILGLLQFFKHFISSFAKGAASFT